MKTKLLKKLRKDLRIIKFHDNEYQCQEFYMGWRLLFRHKKTKTFRESLNVLHTKMRAKLSIKYPKKYYNGKKYERIFP